MSTISVQEMPNGFEVETPTFWYWMKAGVAFTLGAGAVTVFATIVWMWLIARVPGLIVLRAISR
jgi:hypothetical protein